MTLGVEDNNNIKNIYNNYINLHPECKSLTPEAIWLRLKDEGKITSEQYNSIKNDPIFNYNTQTPYGEFNLKNIMGWDTTQEKPSNYVEKIQNRHAQELLADENYNIDLKQFSLENIKQKYNQELYDIEYKKTDFGYQFIEITSKQNNNVKINIQIEPTGFVTYSRKSLNSIATFTIDNSGNLLSSIEGKNIQNYVERFYNDGIITTESTRQNGYFQNRKNYIEGKLTSEEFYNQPNGDYKITYQNGQITQKYMLSGEEKDCYYIYENGKPIKKMFALSKQSWAKEGAEDSLLEDLVRTERINNLVEELYKDIYATSYGFPTTRSTIKKHVMSIKPEDVEDIMKKYEEKTGENLLDAMAHELKVSKALHEHLETLYTKNGDKWETGEYIGEKLTQFSGNIISGRNPINAKEFSRYIKLITPENIIGVLRNFQKPEILGIDLNPILEELNLDISDYGMLPNYNGLLQSITTQTCFTKKQQQELLEHVLTQLENSADINADFIYIKDIVSSVRENMKSDKSLLKDSIRLQIRATKSSTNSINEISKANGKFDLDIQQGNTGDCWLLAGLISIIQKPAGKKALEDCLSVDELGNVTVNLKGFGKVYKISAQEIEESLHLSSGDGDVRAIEIAMDKYIKENSWISTSIDGNKTTTFYNAFFGNGDTLSLDEDFNNPNKFYALSIPFSFDAINKEDEPVEISGKHAIAIVGSDEEYVHVIDPNFGTNEPLRIPWDKFRLMYLQLNTVVACSLPE